jgi:hypothetical protein
MSLIQRIKTRLCPAAAQQPPQEIYNVDPEWVSNDPPLFPKLDFYSDPRKLWNPDAAIHMKQEPYPYYVKDGVLSRRGFKSLIEHWPHKSAFKYRAGYHRYALRMQSRSAWQDLSKSQKEFWRHFIATVCPRIMRESIRLFAPQIVAKYGTDVREVQLQNVELLELFDVQAPIHVHSHHFHSPLWLATAVYYVDDNGHTGRGTTLYRARKGHDSVENLAALAANHRTLDTRPEIERCATVEFAPNRTFIMHDNPIGWHKVEDNTGLGNIGPRRHLLFNWGLPFDQTQNYYGVDRTTFMDIHEKQQGTPQVVSWIKKDINTLKAPATVSEEQLAALEKSITLRGLGALDLF